MARKGNSKAFTNAVSDWIELAEEPSHRIQRDAVHGFVDTLQSNMPNESGNLRRSVIVSDQPMTIGRVDGSTQFEDRSAQNHGVIEAMKPDGKVYVGVQAPYALADNYGSVGSDGKVRAGKFWAEKTASAWRGLVAKFARDKGMKAK